MPPETCAMMAGVRRHVHSSIPMQALGPTEKPGSSTVNNSDGTFYRRFLSYIYILHLEHDMIQRPSISRPGSHTMSIDSVSAILCRTEASASEDVEIREVSASGTGGAAKASIDRRTLLLDLSHGRHLNL